MIFLLSLFTAILPVFFWYLIIIRRSRKNMNFFFFLVFFFSGVFAFFFKKYEPILLDFFGNTLALHLFFSLVLMGMMVEYGKNFIVRGIGKKYFEGIDDVVDLSFATALGFTFLENFLIFFQLFSGAIDFGAPIEIAKKIISQEFFVLPIHLFCSGIFGYFYGVALFANDENGNPNTDWKFKSLQILKGTLISTLTYGIFFLVKTQDPDINDLTNLLGIQNFPVNEKLLPIISYFFFSVGSLYLFQKMEQKKFLVQPKKTNEK